MANTIPAGESSDIDGVWRVSTIGKNIRIEGSRAYAVDSWLHLFTLQIQPNMVVIKNIQADGEDGYSGEDLPLMGKWQAKLAADGALDVSVAGAMAPVSYRLLPVELDNANDDEIDDSEVDDEDTDAGIADPAPDDEEAIEDDRNNISPPKLSLAPIALPKLKFRESCKGISVKAINRSGYDVKIIDIDFYDFTSGRWRSKATKNEKVRKGSSWSKTLSLQKVDGDRTKVRVQYRVKNKKGLFGKKSWSSVINRESATQTCNTETRFAVELL